MNFKLLFIIISILLFGCGYDKFENEPVLDECSLMPNASLNIFYENYYGTHIDIKEDIIFRGRVTATDISGNFYRTFVVQDQTGAMEVNVGIFDLHNIYPLGEQVIIKAEGLTISQWSGVFQLGRTVNDWSNYKVEPLGLRVVADRHIFRTNDNLEVEPKLVTIKGLNEQMCGLLVRLDNIECDNKGANWGEKVRILRDKNGDVLVSQVSDYVNFADQIVPEGWFSITGILYRVNYEGNNLYAIKPRDYDDIKEN